MMSEIDPNVELSDKGKALLAKCQKLVDNFKFGTCYLSSVGKVHIWVAIVDGKKYSSCSQAEQNIPVFLLMQAYECLQRLREN